MLDPIRLEIFKYLFASVAEEMGVTVQRSAYSPNIKERLDHSCALFTGDGQPGLPGRNLLVRAGAEQELPGKFTLELQAGDVLSIQTPEGGGWGE